MSLPPSTRRWLTTAVLLILAPAAPAQLTTGFEGLAAGGFTELRDGQAVWSAPPGHAEIHADNVHAGKHSLRILGGKAHHVTLELAQAATVHELSFWAERWTRRPPFEFRVERRRDGKWREIWNGDDAVKVGGFLTHVRIPVGAGAVQAFRFTCTAPDNSGVILDDLRLAPPVPMRIESVRTLQRATPVLIGNPYNPVLQVQVETSGNLDPIAVRGLRITTDGTTDLGDVANIDVFWTGNEQGLSYRDPKHLFAAGRAFGKARRPAAELRLSGDQELTPGVNTFWVSFALQDDADIDHRIDAGCIDLELAGGQRLQPPLASPPGTKRIGIALRNSGDDGSAAYRIPGLATTNAGTLIAVYDIRWKGWGDLPGDIDVGMSRSTDGGRTWEPMQTILDLGDDPKLHRGDGVGDPAVLIDRRTGTIWVAALWSHGNRAWRGSGPGVSPEETGQLVLAKSTDDGRTWSTPVSVTPQVKDPKWRLLLQGPGKGITMRDGTLVFPAQFKDADDLPHSTVLYSRDRGKTWKVGTGAKPDTTECQVVELDDGELMLNMRDNRGGSRSVYTTRDLGRTWHEHESSRGALPEPVCMASLIRRDERGDRDDSHTLLFSNPAVARPPRRHMTVKVSPDGGRSWPERMHTLVDAGSSAGYSCLTMIDADHVGLLYEGSLANMTFLRLPLTELTGGDRVEKPGKRRSPKSAWVWLPEVFSNGAVLQRDVEVPVWGRSSARNITVRFGARTEKTKVGSDGTWRVALQPLPANAAPRDLVVEGDDGSMVVVRDVLVGEVWLCAGQSNMQFPLARDRDAATALRGAERPLLRLLDLGGGPGGSGGVYRPRDYARLSTERYADGAWLACTAERAPEFSAVAFWFGTALREQLDVPVGLIHLGQGGTPAEAWISAATLKRDPQLRPLVTGNWLENESVGAWCRERGRQNLALAIDGSIDAPANALGLHHCFQPTFMYRAKVAKVVPYALRGAIWYQGESNAESLADVRLHRYLLPALVRDWRAAWGAELPLCYVQLPAMKRPHWPVFRETQRRALAALDGAGMVVALDTGHPTDVHPRDKRPIGERLALWALGAVYGRDVAWSGPVLKSARTEGRRMVLEFDRCDEGLVDRDGNDLRGFEVAGADRAFRPAQAEIAGDGVVVFHPGIAEPRFVRYAWLPYPEPTVELFNRAGLPASPFTTDDAYLEDARAR